MIGLRTERLALRRWKDRDRPTFHRLNSDETVMRFFAFRRSQEHAQGVMPMQLCAVRKVAMEAIAINVITACIYEGCQRKTRD